MDVKRVSQPGPSESAVINAAPQLLYRASACKPQPQDEYPARARHRNWLPLGAAPGAFTLVHLLALLILTQHLYSCPSQNVTPILHIAVLAFSSDATAVLPRALWAQASRRTLGDARVG